MIYFIRAVLLSFYLEQRLRFNREGLSMKLSLKYWTKHKIKAFLIIASIAMCTAALSCMAFLFRSVSAMEYNLYMLWLVLILCISQVRGMVEFIWENCRRKI